MSFFWHISHGNAMDIGKCIAAQPEFEDKATASYLLMHNAIGDLINHRSHNYTTLHTV